MTLLLCMSVYFFSRAFFHSPCRLSSTKLDKFTRRQSHCKVESIYSPKRCICFFSTQNEKNSWLSNFGISAFLSNSFPLTELNAEGEREYVSWLPTSLSTGITVLFFPHFLSLFLLHSSHPLPFTILHRWQKDLCLEKKPIVCFSNASWTMGVTV